MVAGILVLIAATSCLGMQVPGLTEKLVAGREADYFDYFFSDGRCTPSEKAHSLKAYSEPAQLHAAFGMYRAFPPDAQLNAAQKAPNDEARRSDKTRGRRHHCVESQPH